MARSLNVIWRIIGIKHGFVLMVMDHHPTDDTVDSGPGQVPWAGARHGMLLWRHHHTHGGGRRGVKDTRRGRELRDRREGASEEIRGCGGTLLGLQMLRFLEILCLVWIKS